MYLAMFFTVCIALVLFSMFAFTLGVFCVAATLANLAKFKL